jgi:hypothetical protein
VFETRSGAAPVERVPARRRAPAQAEQAVGERLVVVRENGADADRAGALQVAQAAPSWHHRFKPDGESSRSSSEISSALRSAIATGSCAGVSVRRENDPLDRFLFRLTLQPVGRVAAILDAVALAPSPRRSNRWRARGSVQIVCAFVGKTASQVN